MLRHALGQGRGKNGHRIVRALLGIGLGLGTAARLRQGIQIDDGISVHDDGAALNDDALSQSALPATHLQFSHLQCSIPGRLLARHGDRPPRLPRQVAAHHPEQFQVAVEHFRELLLPVRGLLLDLLASLHLRRILGRILGRILILARLGGSLVLRVRHAIGHASNSHEEDQRHGDGAADEPRHSPVLVDPLHGVLLVASRPRSNALK